MAKTTAAKDITNIYTLDALKDRIAGLSAETYKTWYVEMQMMRKFEEKAGQMYGMQKIRGFCHLYIGQEAVVGGLLSAKGAEDKVITAYRDHAHAIALGIPAKEVMAELFGKATGSTKGKGGSMHFFSKEHHMYGGHGIVGAQIPLGAGIAFAEKYRGTDNVCYTYMGDGAVRQGALHEAFTMAQLWQLPAVFICENNRYGMGTAVERTTTIPDLYKIGLGYEMPSFPVDGMQVECVHFAMEDARKSAQEGKPAFLEIKTYRYKGHSMSDPAKYRSKEELEQFKGQDPVENVAKTIIAKGYADEAWFEARNEEIKAIVEESVQFAEESPWPSDDELYRDIYVEENYPFMLD